jgi:regulatory protein
MNDLDDAKPPDAAALNSEIRSRAVKLLKTREHARLDLERKLRHRVYPVDAVAVVLDALEHDGLLSEDRLLETYVNERLEKGFGPLRIRVELQGKGLSDSSIEPNLRIDDAQLLALMTAAHDRRFGADSRGDRQTLAKRARFLEYRGFPSYLIARLLDTED